MADYGDLTPVNIVTGFLGSGKTTLLQRLLRSPELSDVAVLVNEFGEVGLDHHLLQNVAESTLLLENGCLCCAVRGDLQKALRDLLSRRTRGDIPHFRRVVIETSGLADPAPIAYTLLSEAVLRHHFRLSGIITTVDAVNGASQLDRFGESVKQVSMADRLVVTKTDLSDEPTLAALRRRLRGLNVSAHIVEFGRDRRRGASVADRRHLRCSRQIPRGGPLDCRRGRRSIHRTRTRRKFNPLPPSSTGRWIGPRLASGPACCCIATAPTCFVSRVY